MRRCRCRPRCPLICLRAGRTCSPRALNIEAADSQRLADRAAFYPDINLKALAGIGAFGLNNLVQWSARGYGAGPLISLPLFDGGRLRAQYKSSEAQLDEAIAGYNDTVLRAVQQTADQLTRIDALARERVEQQQTLEANEAAYKLAEERYRAGLASYLSVLNAETQVLTARQTMVDIVANQAVARVTLLTAIGGSFDARASGVAHGSEFRSSFDTGNTMNTKDSNETSPVGGIGHGPGGRRSASIEFPCRSQPGAAPGATRPGRRGAAVAPWAMAATGSSTAAITRAPTMAM